MIIRRFIAIGLYLFLGIIAAVIYYNANKIIYPTLDNEITESIIFIPMGIFGLFVSLLIVAEENKPTRKKIRDKVFGRKPKDKKICIRNYHITNETRLFGFLHDRGFKYKTRRGTKLISAQVFSDKLSDAYIMIGGIIINYTKKTYTITRLGFKSDKGKEFLNQAEFEKDYIEFDKGSQDDPLFIMPDVVYEKKQVTSNPTHRHPERVLEIARKEYGIQNGHIAYRPDDDIIVCSFGRSGSRQGYGCREYVNEGEYTPLNVRKQTEDYKEMKKERGIDKYQHGVDHSNKIPEYISSVSCCDGKVLIKAEAGDMVYATDMAGTEGDQSFLSARTVEEAMNKLRENNPTHKNYKPQKQLRDIISL